MSAANYRTLPLQNYNEDEAQFEKLLAVVRIKTPEQLVLLEAALTQAERRIGLIERSFPRNYRAQVERVAQALELGRYVEPRFIYSSLGSDLEQTVTDLQAMRVALGSLRLPSDWGLITTLLDERAVELGLEAMLVLERGSDKFPALVHQRFPIAETHKKAALELSERWLTANDDENEFQEQVDLAAYLSARSRAEGRTFSIIERPIASVAAATKDGLVVQSGARVTEREAERIWVHEVLAHVLPRQAGLRTLVPLRVGTRASGEDEEGRALLLEERHGLLHSERKRNLAIRHQLADTARAYPQDLGQQALALVKRGCSATRVAHALCRSLRGGGLAREAVYLPALIHVKHVLQSQPHLERWMKYGRSSITGSAQLDAWLQSNSIVHGA